MAFGDGLPITESVGVFVGIAGIDWLADGYAEPLKAAVIAISAGFIILIVRKLSRSRKD